MVLVFAHLRILRRVVVRYVTAPLHLQRICSGIPLEIVGLDCSETAAGAPAPAVSPSPHQPSAPLCVGGASPGTAISFYILC